jgi:hypothetical protein
MGYVIAGILVVLIVGAGIAFFVTSAMKGKGQAAIAEPDEGTPLGTTSEHAEPDSASRSDGTTDPNPGVGGPGEGGVGGEGEGSRPSANAPT